MQTEQIQQIPLDDIEPHPGNRSVGGFDEEKLKQLAESIRAVGVQQPAVVRKGAEAGKYQLVAGERRWRAARLSGLETLPCVVRELDDVQTLRIKTIENLQREDIHPLDEADGYQRLIEVAQYGVPDVAHEVGKSPSYVYQRLKLRELIPAAREMLVNGHITAAHALHIARLPTAVQTKITEWLDNENGYELPSASQLVDFIQRQVLVNLSEATFRRDDAKLLPEAGACTACPKRTGYEPALFEDMGADDRCMDHACFRRKLDAQVAKRSAELEGKEHWEAARGWEPGGRGVPKGVIREHEWMECKKKDEGAVPVLIVYGPERGKLTYGRKPQRGDAYGPVDESDEEDDEDTKAWRKQQAERAAEHDRKEHEHRAVFDQVVARIKDGEIPEPLLRVGLRQTLYNSNVLDNDILREVMGWPEIAEDEEKSIEELTDEILSGLAVSDLLRAVVITELAEDLHAFRHGEVLFRHGEVLYEAADLLGIPHPPQDTSGTDNEEDSEE